jgi:glycosyltransferase involved in cell wall biosynthesis
MPTVGYLPFAGSPYCTQAQWLREHLGITARVVELTPSWNEACPPPLPPIDRLTDALAELLPLPAVVLEGPAGFLWAAVLRQQGYRGTVTVLPYLNPRGWRDVLAVALYRRCADPRDRVLVGSRPSAALYSALGAPARVGEPYGIDDRVFQPRPDAARVRAQLGLGSGRLLLYAGRAQPDKDLHRLLRVALRARLLFPDLTVVIASHVADQGYLNVAREQLRREEVRFVLDPPARQLADLYTVADVFVTAATSRFETFGRAPAEALACGCPVVAPRYDGFVELLDQPGGVVAELVPDVGGGRLAGCRRGGAASRRL